MVKVVKLFSALAFSLLTFLYSCEKWTNASDVDYDDERDIYFEGALEDYELDLLWQLKRLKPLMAILTGAKKSSEKNFQNRDLRERSEAEGRRYYGRHPSRHSYPTQPSRYPSSSYKQRRVVPSYDYDIDRNGYGGYGGYGGYWGYGGPVVYGGHAGGSQFSTLGIVSLFATGLLYLLFFYYVSTSTTSSGRRRRRYVIDSDLDFLEDNSYEIVMLDGPTWLSMVHELWEQDDSPENVACIQETLCRMNRLALSAPGQAGWAVSLSSLPLSYLLHARHTGGFTSYIDAALMGRSGANCTELYSSCPRLRY